VPPGPPHLCLRLPGQGTKGFATRSLLGQILTHVPSYTYFYMIPIKARTSTLPCFCGIDHIGPTPESDGRVPGYYDRGEDVQPLDSCELNFSQGVITVGLRLTCRLNFYKCSAGLGRMLRAMLMWLVAAPMLVSETQACHYSCLNQPAAIRPHDLLLVIYSQGSLGSAFHHHGSTSTTTPRAYVRRVGGSSINKGHGYGWTPPMGKRSHIPGVLLAG
jgi:hypothetical protein